MPGGTGWTRRLRHPATAMAALMLAVAAAVTLAPDQAPALASPAGTGAVRSSAGAHGGLLRAVRYRGYRFEIPASWPVISDVRHPDTCVRFDLHAVYLGVPGVNQACPSWLVGTTEALLIEPGPARSPRRVLENPVARQISVTAPGLAMTATFDTNPRLIDRILASAGLPAPVIVPPHPTRPDASVLRSGTGRRNHTTTGQADVVSGAQELSPPPLRYGAAPPELPATVANHIGLGFDVCAAPSPGFMRTWRLLSPYRAIGIYIGGADRACFQQNLTPGWVRLEIASGWRFIPMYVGPQASFGQLARPRGEGAAAAADAVEQAQRLGFGPNTPLYYDMEAYPPGDTNKALQFESAWTRTLHKLGYESGIYSSSLSGVADLVRAYRRRGFSRPDAIFDALWNGLPNARDSVLPQGDWAHARRLHQFSGNVLQTFGGDTMLIDQDYMDLALTAPGGTVQAVMGSTSDGGSATVFYEGTDHRLWEVSRSARGRWQRTDLGGSLSSPPSVVQIGRGEIAVLYRSPSGTLMVRRRKSGRWGRPQALPLMGVTGGPPRAVAQSNGVIDVFWSGHFDNHLWHGEFNPGQGWSGPQPLHGSLASSPYPVETPAGVVDVFWEGTDGRLWRVIRQVGGAWSRPEDLGMGPMGGPPHAVVLSDGETDIFWRGQRPHSIWAAFISSSQRVVGPVNLGGHVGGAPWPVTGAHMEAVFYRGPRRQLWIRARMGGRWRPAVRLTRISNLSAGPFATAGSPGALTVFWVDRTHQLWAESFYGRRGWHAPQDLGGLAA